MQRSGFGNETNDLKFVGSSWLGFFDAHIVPTLSADDLIRYDTPVSRIEHGDDGVVVTSESGERFTADRVVVTIPVAVVRAGGIEFDPPLSDDRLAVRADTPVWSGFKAFFEFDDAV